MLLRSALAGCLIALAAPGAQADLMFVLNSRDASVSVLDAASGALKQTISTGKEPHHLVPTPDRRTLIVAAAVGNELLFLDPATAK